MNKIKLKLLRVESFCALVLLAFETLSRRKIVESEFGGCINLLDFGRNAFHG